jgi:hypothetical protein
VLSRIILRTLCFGRNSLPRFGLVVVARAQDISTRGIAISMTFAHWCYWSAALSRYPLIIRDKLLHRSAPEDDMDVRAAHLHFAPS